MITFILNYRLPCKEIQWRSFHRLTEIPRNYLVRPPVTLGLLKYYKRRSNDKTDFRNFPLVGGAKEENSPRRPSKRSASRRSTTRATDRRCWSCCEEGAGCVQVRRQVHLETSLQVRSCLETKVLLRVTTHALTTDGQVWSPGRGQHGP